MIDMTPMEARFSVVEVHLPVGRQENAGILLEDPSSDSLYLRFRRDWDSIAADEDVEVLELLPADLARKAGEMGARRLLDYCESSLSNSIRITDPRFVAVEDFERSLNRLYREHVPSKVLEFRTHIPRYSLRAAAGKFLENAEVSADGWIEAPEDLRVTPDLFIGQIAGRSMEPLIPDGSLCVFRYGVTGGRQGRLVLVEDLETTGTHCYTVKRYASEKVEDESGWRHSRIRLESLNPSYPSWDLDPDEEKYRIIAEFQRVLE